MSINIRDLRPSAQSLKAARAILSEVIRSDGDDIESRLLRATYGALPEAQRADAGELTTLALQLEFLRARVVSRPYSDLFTLGVVPLSTDIPEDAETVAWSEEDYAGSAQFIDDSMLGDDLKNIEVKLTKQTAKIYTAATAFSYTDAQIRRAGLSDGARAALPARKAEIARDLFMRKADSVFATGASEVGISYGIANQPMGTGASQVRNTAGTLASWTDGTISAQGMLDNLNLAYKNATIAAQGKGDFLLDTLVLPLHLSIKLNQTVFSDAAGGSVLARFQRLNPTVTNVKLLPALGGVDGSTSRILLCKSSNQIFEASMPMAFQLQQPIRYGLGWKIFGIGRLGPVMIYQPLGMHYLSGLPNT